MCKKPMLSWMLSYDRHSEVSSMQAISISLSSQGCYEAKTPLSVVQLFPNCEPWCSGEPQKPGRGAAESLPKKTTMLYSA